MELLPVFTADDNGEQTANVKYLPGEPRQIRFNAKDGEFNIEGVTPIGPQLTFQPIAWEFFTADILNMGLKSWVELFYLDEKNRVCAVLFHGYSVEALMQVNKPLFYDDLTLADIILTVKAVQKENNKIKPKGIYYIAEFTYTMAETQRTHDLKALAAQIAIYRRDTVNYSRLATITSEGYRVPQNVINRVFGLQNGNGPTAELPAAS